MLQRVHGTLDPAVLLVPGPSPGFHLNETSQFFHLEVRFFLQSRRASPPGLTAPIDLWISSSLSDDEHAPPGVLHQQALFLQAGAPLEWARD